MIEAASFFASKSKKDIADSLVPIAIGMRPKKQ
jgi:hypothetical protein